MLITAESNRPQNYGSLASSRLHQLLHFFVRTNISQEMSSFHAKYFLKRLKVVSKAIYLYLDLAAKCTCMSTKCATITIYLKYECNICTQYKCVCVFVRHK